MTDILTLAQARAALGWRAGVNTEHDAELVSLYLPANTAEVLHVLGVRRIEDREETLYSRAASPITTPWSAATVVAVRINGYLVTSGYSFAAPTLTITAGYTALTDEVAITVKGITTPERIIMAAGLLLKASWQPEKQGGRPTVAPTPDAAVSPASLRSRALRMLDPYRRMDGFA